MQPLAVIIPVWRWDDLKFPPDRYVAHWGQMSRMLVSPQGSAPHTLHLSRLMKDTLMPDTWAAPCDIFNFKGIPNWIQPCIKVKNIKLLLQPILILISPKLYFNRFSLPCACVSSLFTPVTRPVMVCSHQGCILASHLAHAGIDCSSPVSPIRKEQRLTDRIDWWMDGFNLASWKANYNCKIDPNRPAAHSYCSLFLVSLLIGIQPQKG